MVRAKCLFAGLIIQCFFNGMLLVGLGTHDEYAEEAEQDYHVRVAPVRIFCFLIHCFVALPAAPKGRGVCWQLNVPRKCHVNVTWRYHVRSIDASGLYVSLLPGSHVCFPMMIC